MYPPSLREFVQATPVQTRRSLSWETSVGPGLALLLLLLLLLLHLRRTGNCDYSACAADSLPRAAADSLPWQHLRGPPSPAALVRLLVLGLVLVLLPLLLLVLLVLFFHEQLETLLILEPT